MTHPHSARQTKHMMVEMRQLVILQIDFLDRHMLPAREHCQLPFWWMRTLFRSRYKKSQVFMNVLIISYYLIETYISTIILN
jgi:hypothetical protein